MQAGGSALWNAYNQANRPCSGAWPDPNDPALELQPGQQTLGHSRVDQPALGPQPGPGQPLLWDTARLTEYSGIAARMTSPALEPTSQVTKTLRWGPRPGQQALPWGHRQAQPALEYSG
jgi:hypothetical protein